MAKRLLSELVSCGLTLSPCRGKGKAREEGAADLDSIPGSRLVDRVDDCRRAPSVYVGEAALDPRSSEARGRPGSGFPGSGVLPAKVSAQDQSVALSPSGAPRHHLMPRDSELMAISIGSSVGLGTIPARERIAGEGPSRGGPSLPLLVNAGGSQPRARPSAGSDKRSIRETPSRPTSSASGASTAGAFPSQRSQNSRLLPTARKQGQQDDSPGPSRHDSPS